MPNHSTALPIYIQISELLQREIAAGLYAAGDRLPPEAELANTLNVAVGTLRKALSELASRGMLERIHGSGTYVKAALDSGSSKSIYEFFRLELLYGAGLPTAKILRFEKIETPLAFQVAFSKKCYRVRRLRFLNNQPIAVEEIYFDSKYHPQLTQVDLGEALYLFYKERLGFWIASAEDRIGMGAVPNWSPPEFQPRIGSACPNVERISYSGKNTIEEYSITWFDSQRCRYVNRMK